MKLAALAFLATLLPLAGQEIAPGYASFVCWDYPHLPHLTAWRETERIIATALAESYPAFGPADRRQNGTPAALADFLAKLPHSTGGVTLVYLAAHQSPGGQWHFCDDSFPSWATMSAGLPSMKERQRLVFLDCCYAESAALYPGWTKAVAPACVYASDGRHPTPDLFVYRRRPVDVEKLFPRASGWLQRHDFRDSDERVSFLGLCWLETWLGREAPPKTWAQWRDFARALVRTGTQAQERARSGMASIPVLSFP